MGKVAMKMESAGRYHSRAHCVTFALSRLLCFSPPRDCIAVREVGVVPWSCYGEGTTAGRLLVIPFPRSFPSATC